MISNLQCICCCSCCHGRIFINVINNFKIKSRKWYSLRLKQIKTNENRQEIKEHKPRRTGYNNVKLNRIFSLFFA